MTAMEGVGQLIGRVAKRGLDAVLETGDLGAGVLAAGDTLLGTGTSDATPASTQAVVPETPAKRQATAAAVAANMSHSPVISAKPPGGPGQRAITGALLGPMRNPINASYMESYFGQIPTPLPKLKPVPPSVVFDAEWPAVPCHKSDNILEGIRVGIDSDGSWDSPVSSTIGNIQIMDFTWRLAPTMDGTATSTDAVPTLVEPGRNLLPATVGAMRDYGFYHATRVGLRMQITQRSNTRCGVYFALVCPLNAILWQYNSSTGVRDSAADRVTLPPFARNNASLGDTVPGSDIYTWAETEEFPATVAGAQQRIAQMKSSPFTVDWCYFPPSPGVDAEFDGSRPAPQRHLRFNSQLANLHADTPWNQFMSDTAVDFTAALYYGPDNSSLANTQREYNFYVGRCPFDKQRFNGATSNWPGIRLIMITDGPGADDTEASRWDTNQTATVGAAAFTFNAATSTQFVFFQPTLLYQDLDMNVPFAPQTVA